MGTGRGGWQPTGFTPGISSLILSGCNKMEGLSPSLIVWEEQAICFGIKFCLMVLLVGQVRLLEICQLHWVTGGCDSAEGGCAGYGSHISPCSWEPLCSDQSCPLICEEGVSPLGSIPRGLSCTLSTPHRSQLPWKAPHC